MSLKILNCLVQHLTDMLKIYLEWKVYNTSDFFDTDSLPSRIALKLF